MLPFGDYRFAEDADHRVLVPESEEITNKIVIEFTFHNGCNTFFDPL